MTARPAPQRAAPSVHPPVLHPALLARVHQLNQHYVQLLLVDSATVHGGTQWSQLPQACRDDLRRLSPLAIERLCAAPYPLYSLGFENPQLWPAACARTRAQTWVPMVHEPHAGLDAQRSFVELALLHAWHVAVSHPVAARVIYAMGREVIQAFGRVALPRVMLAAGTHCDVLAPRWPTNPCFWPDLIRYAHKGDVKRVSCTHLLGSQLLAAEMELVDLPDDVSASAQRAAISPRLRERHSRLALCLNRVDQEGAGDSRDERTGCRLQSAPRRPQ